MPLQPSDREDLEKALRDRNRSLSEFDFSVSSQINPSGKLRSPLGALVGHRGSVVDIVSCKFRKTGSTRTYRVQNSISYGRPGESVQWVKDFIRDLDAGEF